MNETAATRQRVAAFLESDYAKVVGTVALATGNRDAAEDAVQDALVKALTTTTEPRNLAGWVTVVAINFVKQGWRRNGARDRAYIKVVEWEPSVDEAQHTVDHIAVAAALRELPQRQRLTVVLHYFEGLSVKEIATTLQVSQGTVKTQLSRGRAALASLLDKEVAR